MYCAAGRPWTLLDQVIWYFLCISWLPTKRGTLQASVSILRSLHHGVLYCDNTAPTSIKRRWRCSPRLGSQEAQFRQQVALQGGKKLELESSYSTQHYIPPEWHRQFHIMYFSTINETISHCSCTSQRSVDHSNGCHHPDVFPRYSTRFRIDPLHHCRYSEHWIRQWRNVCLG